MSKGYQTHLPYTSYPGSEYYYGICDVCGKKYRMKDMVQVEDKFNLQNRLIVCRKDLDKPQPQLRPFKAREYKALKKVRPNQAHVNLAANPEDAASAPQLLQATLDPLTDNIDLFWQGPEDCGSSAIQGYVIYQSWPQLSFPQVIDANTQNGAPFYQDPLTPVDAQCSYQVAAINSAGIGTLSAPAFYPAVDINLSQQYICMSNGTNKVIRTGSGLNIIMGHVNG